MKKKIMDPEEELARAKGELKIFHWLSRSCSSDVSMDELLDKFTDLLLEVMKVEAGSILLHRDSRLFFKVAKGKKAKPLKETAVKDGEGIVGWVVKTGKSVIVRDVRKDRRFTTKFDEITGFKTKSILAVPLKMKGRIMGAIEILNPAREPFSGGSLEFLESLASQVVIAIENVYLLEETKERFSEMNALFDVSHIITSSIAQETLLNSIMRSATNMLEVEAISLLLVDGLTNELVFKVALGEKGRKIKEFRIPIDETSIAGWVAKNGKPIIVNDVMEDTRFNPHYGQKVDFRTKSILCVPLKIKDRIIGVAEAINKKDDERFDSRDQDLFATVANQIAMASENTKLNQDLEIMLFGTVASLVTAIEAKDTYTKGHSERVTEYALMLGRALKLSEDELVILRLSSLLHDIGKIGVMEGVLSKKDPLTEEEWKSIRQHPATGAKILEPVKQISNIIPFILHHHERYDGKGYPDCMSGEGIPLFSRIIAIGDTFDAMTSDRPYRKGLSAQIALGEIEKNRGTQFDPHLAEVFIQTYRGSNEL